MTYAAFNSSKPVVGTGDTRQATVDYIRNNLMALRDALVATGVVQGWAYSYSGSDAGKPDYIVFARGTEKVKVVLTWGSAGGAADNCTKAAFYYLPSGTTYDPMADGSGNYVLALNYDANSNLTSTSWGATP